MHPLKSLHFQILTNNGFNIMYGIFPNLFFFSNYVKKLLEESHSSEDTIHLMKVWLMMMYQGQRVLSSTTMSVVTESMFFFFSF